MELTPWDSQIPTENQRKNHQVLYNLLPLGTSIIGFAASQCLVMREKFNTEISNNYIVGLGRNKSSCMWNNVLRQEKSIVSQRKMGLEIADRKSRLPETRKSWILEKNPLPPLHFPSIISSWILNTYPYTQWQCNSHPSPKKLPLCNEQETISENHELSKCREKSLGQENRKLSIQSIDYTKNCFLSFY